MDETDFHTLLASFPVSWREIDRGAGPVGSGGGAFADERAARRFLAALCAERAGPSRLPDDGAYQTLPFADLSPAAVFVRDPHGRYVWANHAYAHMYGTTRDTLIGRHLSDFDEPDDAARFLALDEEVLTRGHPVRHTLVYQRSDGSPGHAAGYRFPVRWGSPCVAGIYVDITDYVHALDERRRAEEDLRALRDHSGLPCLRLSADGVVGEASAAVAEVLRVRLRDLVGHPADRHLAPTPERTALHRVWGDLVGGRRRSVRTSAVIVDGDQRRRRAWVCLSASRHAPERRPHIWAVITQLGLSDEAQPPLTATQVRILALLAAGHNNVDISKALHLSRQTIDYHLGRLRHRLDAPTRPALVARAYALGILSPHVWPPRATTATHPRSPA